MWKTSKIISNGRFSRKRSKASPLHNSQLLVASAKKTSRGYVGEGREPPIVTAAAVAEATSHGDMSNTSQMRELGGLVDNLYLSSKNRHHQDVTAAAPTQSRKNTKVGPYSFPVQACPYGGGERRLALL